MSKPKILVSLLSSTERTGWINPELVSMLLRMSHDARFAVAVVNVKDARPFEVARNHTIKLARDNKVDWLVSFDNDNFMPVGTPLDVIAAASPQQSVIGLTCGIPKRPGYCLYPPREHVTTTEGAFQEVESVGGGVLMVNRKVWEKIPSGPWFRWQYGADVETLDQSSGGCGEDVYFCNLVRQSGMRVWTHRDFLAGHYRTTDLTGMVCTLARRP